MPLIIDGYNLLHASGILGSGRGQGHLERARTALLNCLAESLPENEISQTAVVFDAREPPWNVARQVKHAGITVHFASRYEDADSQIEELIRAHTSPKKLTVVSSDHRLHRAAKRRKATPVDSDVWFLELMRSRAARNQPDPEKVVKPEGPFSNIEVEYWLKHFGMEHDPS
jgi:predicted RNA-binding protein with PIN domain